MLDKRPVGRPPVENKRIDQKQIHLYLYPHELALIDEGIKASGDKSMAVFARAALQDRANQMIIMQAKKNNKKGLDNQ